MTKFPFISSRPIDVICMGRVAVDLYAEQINVPLSAAKSFRLYLGGCAGNIAVGTARLGLKPAMFSCVGHDDMGQFILDTLQRERVDTTLLTQTHDHLTGLVLLGVCPPDHFPLIFYRENCADMQMKPTDVDKIFFEKAKALLVTGTGFSTASMRETSHHAIKVARNCNTAVILDIDYRPVLWGVAAKGDGESRFTKNQMITAHYQKILPHCDLIVGTEEEILIAGGGDELSQALQVICSLTCAPIVLKRGEKGCDIYCTEYDKPIRGKSYPVKVLNVLGAGDAFMSGFLRGWFSKADWKTCAQYGNACGAIVVTRHSCSAAMPYFEEMKLFMGEMQRV